MGKCWADTMNEAFDCIAKIAVLMPVGGTGGVQKVMANLVKGLVNLGWSVDIICGDASDGVAGVPDDIDIIDLGKTGLKGDFKLVSSFLAIRMKLRERNYACILTAPGFAGQIGVLAAWGFSTKVIVMVDNKLSILRNGSLKGFVQYHSAKALYHFADAVVTAHDAALKDVRETLGKRCRAQIKRIYHPLIPSNVDELKAAPVEASFEALTPVVAAAGRLVEEKDFATLLRCFASLRTHIDAVLVLFGDGPQREGLESLARSLGIEEWVRFWGNIDNVYRYFSRSSAFVLSSRREAFGNVLVEALACGLPCVATLCASGGPQEILRDGQYGELVAVGDVDAMANALLSALSRDFDREKVLMRGMEFSVERSAREYSSLIKDVIGR